MSNHCFYVLVNNLDLLFKYFFGVTFFECYYSVEALLQLDWGYQISETGTHYMN